MTAGDRDGPVTAGEPAREEAPSPLDGVRVLEVANMIAAPAAGAIMADLGASVIKVEPRSGDILRRAERMTAAGVDPWFELDNRGKRSLALDLGRPEALDIVHRLAADADVFLTNLTAQRQQRFAMTAADIHRVAPTVVHASLTGYGTEGPDAGRLAYDMTAFFARGGIQSLVAEPGAAPSAFRPGQGDHTSSLSLLAAVLAALRLRDRTGEGQVVEVALLHVAAWTIASDLAGTLVTGVDPSPPPRHRWPSPLTCRFRCADDRWVALCMPGPKDFFPAFAECLGHREWLGDDRFATAAGRAEHAETLIALCDAVFATAPRDRWAPRLDQHGLTWAPIQSATDLIADPQAAAIGVFDEIDDHPAGPLSTVTAPFAIKGSALRPRSRAPLVGEHSMSILDEVGFTPSEIADLLGRSVVDGPDRV